MDIMRIGEILNNIGSFKKKQPWMSVDKLAHT